MSTSQDDPARDTSQAPPSAPDSSQPATVDAPGHCRVPEVAPRVFAPGTDPARASAILVFGDKWLDGTELRYTFLADRSEWVGTESDKEVVRTAFRRWKEAKIGLSFIEVYDPQEAEVRVGFDHTDGSWSYVGRQVLKRPLTERTMNFGWPLDESPHGFDTALHEIGHTLGLPHEHQNPNAGLVWDEAAVYRYFGGPPNHWSRENAYHNVLRKLSPDLVRGSNWDRNSIMHYQFPAGIIVDPEEYRTAPLVPEPNLSDEDIKWIVGFYPPLKDELEQLHPLQSKPLRLSPGQQVDYLVQPEATAMYTIQTFGKADTVLGLFEEVDGDDGGLRFRAGDDDSGTEFNASVAEKLYKGRRYVVRLRLYWAWASGETALMLS